MRKALLAGMVLAFLACGPLAAQGQKPARKDVPARDLLQAADKDKDGKVTFEEMKAVRPNMPEERFKALDRNKDGVLTKADFPDEPGEFVDQAIRKGDQNGDGAVTAEEFKAAFPKAPPERFAKMDRNKDGVLSKADVADGTRPPLAKLVEEADANGDGKVTFEEMQKVAPNMTKERFGQLDKNKDGVLTKEDRPAAQASAGPIRPFTEVLQEADKDKDGKVTFDELKAVAPQLTKERFARFDKNGDGAISSADGPIPDGASSTVLAGPSVRQKLMAADADNDGKVTFEEAKKLFPNLTEEKYKKHDTNSDGVITKEDTPIR